MPATFPTPTPPAYPLPDPNESLLLYDGPGKLNDRPGRVTLHLHLEPKLDIKADFDDAEEYGSLRALGGGSAMVEFRTLALDDIPVSFDVMPIRWGSDGVTVIPRGPVSIGDADASLSRVVVHLVNFHGELSGAPLTDKPDDEFGSVWAGRNVITGSGWRITVDARQEHRETVEALKAQGGYGFTHVAELTRESGEQFSPEDAGYALWCLTGLLSFARGAWVAPVLPVGYDSADGVVWREWGEPRCSEWHVPQTWLDTLHHEDLRDVAPGFFEWWYRDDCWRESLWRAVVLYVEANASGGRQPGMLETRVILAQAALELLGWVILDDGCSQPIGEERRPEGTPADRVRALLHRAGIPRSPGYDLLPALERFCNEVRCDDVVHAVTELRNRFTHPRRRAGQYTAGTSTLLESWKIAMWWLQLILLHEFGYHGAYVPHHQSGGWRTRQPVPWAASDEVHG